MLQSFEVIASPEQGPPRLAALRKEIAREGLAGFLVPRADWHQCECVAPCDERLAWLTGFTGSAGFCAVLGDVAGIFVDGRYSVQVGEQVAAEFTPISLPDTRLGDWLAEKLESGIVGFDPWLHTVDEIGKLEARLEKTGIVLQPTENLIDRIWPDKPERPAEPVQSHPEEFAGESDSGKRARLGRELQNAGHKAAVITLPDSICWMLNIRGADIPRIPIVQAFAILFSDGAVRIFSDQAKFTSVDLDAAVTVAHWDEFEASLRDLQGPVRIDKAWAPLAVSQILEDAGIEIAHAEDPCILPKACKNQTEISGARDAHSRDAAAMCEFLAWLADEGPKGGLTEIDVVRSLEEFRRATNALRDISFETIAGFGPHGAVVHYRVTNATNSDIEPNGLLLVDSGGQYLDGTTDVTRTVAIGTPTQEQRECFTRVLQGMIAISRVRWPTGRIGRDIDVLARIPLWRAGQDYDHGTGHGVGCYLSVHEGPQRLAKASHVPLQPGMILSNEPGYYREGAFGIRIENLVAVREAPALPGGDERAMLEFETLTQVPIDLTLVEPRMMAPDELDWLNQYHESVLTNASKGLSPRALAWLDTATRPIS